jgi:PAS domain S-box-containing protein
VPTWIAFLAGVLIASLLAMTAQAARTAVTSEKRGKLLAVVDSQLAGETGQREKLEALLAAANARLYFSDESLPAMLAFVDHNTRYQYHNRAFGNWIGLLDKRIDGQHMREVLGAKVFAEVEPYILEAAAGRIVRYERTHKNGSGAIYRVAVQYLPQFGEDGKYAGFYVVITDITERRDVGLTSAAEAAPAESPASEQAGEWQEAKKRILAAINGNAFALFCQRITPLSVNAPGPGNFEVLIRLREEESGMVPPGAFFPLAEEHGLLPQLDRWVFSHVLDWIVTPEGAATARAGAIYFINITSATISDPDFPEFVEAQLRRTGAPAASVCVEINESDLVEKQGDAVEFARRVKQSGCLTAVSGFGRNRLSVEALKLFPLDFLKIDGGIVRQILAYPTYLGRIDAISTLAKSIGVRTIAEMVEDDATLALLRVLKVDFAQGFGVSRPQLLADLRPSAAGALHEVQLLAPTLTLAGA